MENTRTDRFPLEVYFMERTLFIELIHRANKDFGLYWLKDILRDLLISINYGYAHRDFVACINTAEASL